MRRITMAEYIEGIKTTERDVPDTNVGDLISRQAAIEAIFKYCRESCDEYKIGQFAICDACRLGVAIEHLEAAPTIDPVKHGMWTAVDGRYDRHKCSVCGNPAFTVGGIYDDDEELTNYCPNCGARMDAE